NLGDAPAYYKQDPIDARRRPKGSSRNSIPSSTASSASRQRSPCVSRLSIRASSCRTIERPPPMLSGYETSKEPNRCPVLLGQTIEPGTSNYFSPVGIPYFRASILSA